MAHIHSVYDTDTHFKIDAATKTIKIEGSSPVLVQGSHNSERYTFELPRYIDGHDMSLCNRAEVHYLNINGLTSEKNPGLYEVEDLQISPDSEDVVICSWLISGNATQHIGNLNFILSLKCVSDTGSVDYVWNIATYSDVLVVEAINNTEPIAFEYSDILTQWKAEIDAAFAGVDLSEYEETTAVDEKLKSKADLIDGKVPVEQLPDDISSSESEIIFVNATEDEEGNFILKHGELRKIIDYTGERPLFLKFETDGLVCNYQGDGVFTALTDASSTVQFTVNLEDETAPIDVYCAFLLPNDRLISDIENAEEWDVPSVKAVKNYINTLFTNDNTLFTNDIVRVYQFCSNQFPSADPILFSLSAETFETIKNNVDVSGHSGKPIVLQIGFISGYDIFLYHMTNGIFTGQTDTDNIVLTVNLETGEASLVSKPIIYEERITEDILVSVGQSEDKKQIPTVYAVKKYVDDTVNGAVLSVDTAIASAIGSGVLE